ncbi:hypothetical protein GGI17_000145 [Coemansia sp. S146]|nr:hypothetical protein GGI17_000145 [Coemansia sp. S146]
MTANYAWRRWVAADITGIRGYVSSDNDSDGKDDNDYVYMASVTGDSSDDEDSSDDSNEALASDVAFIAHSVYGPGSTMTRAMYTRHMVHSEQIPRMLPFSRGETESLVALIRSMRPATEPVSEDSVLRIVCWKAPHCLMLRLCRYLCLYNEYWSALALRNFDNSPCCHRSVIGYSRVYAV